MPPKSVLAFQIDEGTTIPGAARVKCPSCAYGFSVGTEKIREDEFMVTCPCCGAKGQMTNG